MQGDGTDGGWGRRRVLALGGLAAVGGLAGCGGGDGGGTTAGGDPTTVAQETTAATERTATATPTIRGTTSAGEPTTTETAPTATTAPTTQLSEPSLVAAPGSAHGPLDGFAGAGWLDGTEPTIHRVTTLDARGEGSLRAALDASGPRLVVFEVGGVIDWGEYSTSVDDPRLFVAGQTAPSPGITVVRSSLVVDADDVVIQHLRVRPGDEGGGQVDAMSTGTQVADVIFDHCSASWSVDEVMSTGGGEQNENVTFSNNLIAEPLHDSVHPKGPHAMGSLIMNDSGPVALLGNCFASTRNRNPRLKGGTRAAVVNNYVYNYDNGVRMGRNSDRRTRASIVGNHYEAGPLTDTDEPIVAGDGDPTPNAHVADTRTTPRSTPVRGGGFEELSRPPVWAYERFDEIPAADVKATVLDDAGARPADRSPVDRRIVRQVRNGEHELIDSQREVGGYPVLSGTERALDPPDWGEGFTEWLFEHTLAVRFPDRTAPEDR